jgi:ElaA protein
MEIEWKWYAFGELSTEELYSILKLRQQVFVVEQQCAYLDCDGSDQHSYHLVGWHNSGPLSEPVAYLRIIPQKKQDKLPGMGRLLTHHKFRNKGIGREIMQRGLKRLEEMYPGSPVRISAQLYLTGFYESMGFLASSDCYEEDGIPHIEMILNPGERVR